MISNSKRHIMKLEPHSFDKMRSGEKVIEIRLCDEKRQGIRTGDTVEFKKDPEQTKSLNTEVIELLSYKSFEDLIDSFPLTNFGYSNREQLLQDLYCFYTKEDIEQYGVLGIRIKVIR